MKAKLNRNLSLTSVENINRATLNGTASQMGAEAQKKDRHTHTHTHTIVFVILNMKKKGIPD